MKIFIVISVWITLTNYAYSQLLLTENLNSNVTLSVYPPFIVEGLASQVDITCTFKRDSVTSMASVMSMLIAHSNETDQPVFNYLASVNGMEGHAHNVSHDVEVISGTIDNKGESELHMRFKYPETHLIGLYMCEVTGFDQIGKPVSILSTLNVLTSKITDLFDLIDTAKLNLSAVQNSVTRMQACIKSQEDYIETLLHKVHPVLDTNFFPSIFYNGHYYYLSHAFLNFNRTEIQSTCGEFEGYLAELDTHDEFGFIREYLIKLNVSNYVYNGATDAGHEGIWINEHNLTSIPSFQWEPGRPIFSRGNDCQCFNPNKNWFLADCTCPFHGANSQYICEVPRKMC